MNKRKLRPCKYKPHIYKINGRYRVSGGNPVPMNRIEKALDFVARLNEECIK